MSSLMHFLSLAIETSLAQGLGTDAVDAVGGQLSNVAGGGFGDIAALVATNLVPFVNAVAVLAIVIAGFLAVIAQDENRIAVARKVVVMSLIGIALINTAAALSGGLLTAFDFDGGANPQAGASIITNEILGFIRFVETPLAIFAIITIIAYGLKAVIDYNGEQGPQAFRKAVISVLTGILLVIVRFVVAESIVTGDPRGIIHPAVRTLFTIVSFAAFIGVVVIAGAGIYLVLNLGDESRAEKAKNIIVSVLAGLVFMLVIAGLLMVLIDGAFA